MKYQSVAHVNFTIKVQRQTRDRHFSATIRFEYDDSQLKDFYGQMDEAIASYSDAHPEEVTGTFVSVAYYLDDKGQKKYYIAHGAD